MASCDDPSIDNIMSPEDGEQTESNVRDRGTVSAIEGRFPCPNPDLRPDSPSFVHEASFAYGTRVARFSFVDRTVMNTWVNQLKHPAHCSVVM